MAQIVDRVTSRLSVPSAEQRAEIAAGPRDSESHARWFDALRCLHEVEVHPPAASATAPDCTRVVAWNVERGRDAPSLARVIGAESPALVLLTELDVGMARSGNLHTGREIARALGMGCVYGVEFVELGLGGPDERAAHAGESNECGLHGAAILSASPLERPAVVRFEPDGAWFDGERGERRVGSRIAVIATWEQGDSPVTVASVHLESHSGLGNRASQTAALLDALEAYAPGRPALVAGDLNTFSVSAFDLANRDRLREKLQEDRSRLLHPVPYEPLFEAARGRGFSWEDCNDMHVATHRVPTPAPSARGGLKLDWFLARGLSCSAPRVLEAAHPTSGTALSDHEPIAVTCVV